MLYHERKLEIITQLQKNNSLKISELSKLLSVSVDTIRRDLKQMEKENLLKYVHGGAVIEEDLFELYRFAKFSGREIMNQDKKYELAKKAVCEIQEGDVVFLNAGTTTTLLSEVISTQCKNITIITNNFSSASLLMNEPESNKFKVILPSGEMDHEERSLFGHSCEQFLLQHFPDVSFYAINAVNDTNGYTDFRQSEIGIMRIMAKNSKKNIAVMDSSKFGCRSKQLVFAPNEIDILYTDNNITEQQRKLYTQSGFHIK